MTGQTYRRAFALLAAASLASCALMGGGGKPTELYQFGDYAPSQPATDQIPSQSIVVAYLNSTFERQSSGPRIMTSTGNQAAYVANARWVAPAQELFDSATIRRVESVSPAIRVVRAGTPPKADYLLAIEVHQFQASFDNGPESAPQIVVSARAKLIRTADRKIVQDWQVTQREAAQENRVSAIVAAFDRATQTVTSQIADHVRQTLVAS